MNISIANQSYGKARVCMSYIDRGDQVHNFTQLVADISLQGDFDNAYLEGDNSMVVPTDTMKNTVYAIARLHGVKSIEIFARYLADHFYDQFDQVKQSTVTIAQQLWQRIDLDGEDHGHAFTGGGSEQNTCTVSSSVEGISMTSGLKGLQVLKTTESGFEGFHDDPYTTLRATNDRIFATTITASWPCREIHYDWTMTRQTVRTLLLDVFCHQYSPSVQKTLYEMGNSVLSACREIDEISLNMPNQHHILADLEKLNLENNNDIFVPTPEPFGVISATVRRDG